MKINFKIEKFISIKQTIEKSVFIYPLLLSLVSALIFYYFFTVLPRKNDLKRIEPQIEFHVDKILLDGMFIVTEMTYENISQSKYYNWDITIDELNIALKDCYYDTELKYNVWNEKGGLYDIGDFVSDYLLSINNNIEQLLRYVIYLDPELISIINEIQRNNLFEIWRNSNEWRKKTMNGEPVFVRTNLSNNSKNLLELYKLMHKLENYMSLHYYDKLKNYRIKATRAYFFLNDYLQAIKYNKKILKINKLDKEALFYLGASYIEISQIEKGVEYLKKRMKYYPDSKPFILSNIKNKVAVEKVFH